MSSTAVMTGDNTGPGFFGKLPALGDFVQRRLPQSFVQPWDAWLQAAVASSKAQLGEHWLNTYLSSPVWRFGLSAGVTGDDAWVGVMIPSVDRVGRYFPLAVAAPVQASTVFTELLNQPEWFEGMEDVALSALEENGFEIEAFSERLLAQGACPERQGRTHQHDLATLSQGWHVPLNELSEASQVARSFSDRVVHERFAQLSFWWTEGSELVAPCVLMYAGLPPASAYTAFLDGRWQESGSLVEPATVDS